MRVKIDKGSGYWVSDDLKIVLSETLNGNACFILGFPRMNEVDVEEVVIQSSKDVVVLSEAFPLPKGIHGRDVNIDSGAWIGIPSLGVRIALMASLAGLEVATFEVNIN